MLTNHGSTRWKRGGGGRRVFVRNRPKVVVHKKERLATKLAAMGIACSAAVMLLTVFRCSGLLFCVFIMHPLYRAIIRLLILLCHCFIFALPPSKASLVLRWGRGGANHPQMKEEDVSSSSPCGGQILSSPTLECSYHPSQWTLSLYPRMQEGTFQNVPLPGVKFHHPRLVHANGNFLKVPGCRRETFQRLSLAGVKFCYPRLQGVRISR